MMSRIWRTGLLVFVLTLFLAVPVNAASGSIEGAISEAHRIANDNSHGYSQQRRWGNPDYDCSSFIYTVFHNAGFDVPVGSGWTGSMIKDFTRAGFKAIPWSSIGGKNNLRRGDILLNTATHTELYLGNNQNIGAHSAYGSPQGGDQSGREIAVSGYYFHPWNYVLRYNGAVPPPNYTKGIWQVNTDVLNVRTGPGTNHGRIASTYRGIKYNVTEISSNWGKIRYNGQEAWICLDYCTRIGDLPSIGYPNIKALISNTPTGEGDVDLREGSDVYLRYELIDPASGKRYSDAGGTLSYSVKETISYASGRVVSECTYQNSDNNFIGIRHIGPGSYKAVVEVKGEINGKAELSFDVLKGGNLVLDAWISDSENGPEVKEMKVDNYYYLCYRMYDADSGKALNELVKKNYKVTLQSKGGDVYEKSFDNTDSGCLRFYAKFPGKYTCKAILTGELDSVAETIKYCFEPRPANYYGDLDSDKDVDNDDLEIVRGINVGSVTPTDDQKIRGDLNGDDIIDVLDIAIIRSYIEGDIDHFKVEDMLRGITLSGVPVDRSCLTGDDLPLSGITVTAYYGDGTSKKITDYTVVGSSAQTGVSNVEMSYTEDEVTQTASLPVNVYSGTIQTCDVSINPANPAAIAAGA